MRAIIKKVSSIIASRLNWPALPLEPLPERPGKKLWLTPEAFVRVINGPVLAQWALQVSSRLRPPRLPKRPGGRPQSYRDVSVLLMAVVQTAWRMPYSDIVDYVRSHSDLADLPGFTERTSSGKVVSISQGQYWERRAALGILPLLLFFPGIVAQLVRLGVVTGRALMVDSTRLKAWRHYAGQAAVFGYKIHTVLCHHADLPVFVVITPANVHDSLVGFLSLVAAVLIYGFQVWVVYADAAYFDHRILGFIHDVLDASPAVDYNPRGKGKRFLATLFFLGQWRRYVLGPRSAIERHFAWLKRYFGLKYFQCYIFVRVSQFVLLTYVVAVAVALAAKRYNRPDLVRSRCAVLAHARP